MAVATETVEEIVKRQEGYGPGAAMGLGAGLSAEPKIAVSDALWVLESTLCRLDDPVISKGLLRTLIDAIRMDIGLNPKLITALRRLEVEGE